MGGATKLDLGAGVAVVTGAGSGIGEGIARAAAARGMTLVLADVAADRLTAVADDINAGGGRALAVVTDVRDGAQVQALADRAYAEFGEVSLLVNNAGIELLGLIWEISDTDWRRTLDIILLGMIHGIRAFVPKMLAAGRPAAIANLSSIGGVGMAPLHAGYIVSKHAALSLSECLALELEMVKAPIRVSAVLPGPVATRIFADAPVAGDGAFLRAHHAQMLAMLRDHGLAPVEAGRRILDGIANGDFWVSPHPAMMEQATERSAAHRRARARPVLSTAFQRQLAEFEA